MCHWAEKFLYYSPNSPFNHRVEGIEKESSVSYWNTHMKLCRWEKDGEWMRTSTKENLEKVKYFSCLLKYQLLFKTYKVNSDQIDSRTVCLLFQQYLLPYGTFKYWVWKGKKRTQGSLVKNAPEVWRQQPSLLLDIQTFLKLYCDSFFFFFFFLLGDSTPLYDQTLDSHFQVILHDFHTEEVLSMRFQESSQAHCIFAVFSSINILTSAPKYSTISYYFSIFSFPHRKFKAFLCFPTCYTFGSNISWICRREQSNVGTIIFLNVFDYENLSTSTYPMMNLNSLHEHLRINKVFSTTSGFKNINIIQVKVC